MFDIKVKSWSGGFRLVLEKRSETQRRAAGGIQKLAATGPQGPEDRLVPGATGAPRRPCVGGADPAHQHLATVGAEVAKIRPMHLAGPGFFLGGKS